MASTTCPECNDPTDRRDMRRVDDGDGRTRLVCEGCADELEADSPEGEIGECIDCGADDVELDEDSRCEDCALYASAEEE